MAEHVKQTEKKVPSIALSLLVFVGILLILSVGIAVFKMDVITLLVVCLVATFAFLMTLGYTMDELFDAMGTALKNASVSLLFFMIIGMLIASWIIAGTVPTLIYYGLKFITPGLFLPLGFLACCVTAFVTGTSWGTAGTIGIALLGMGTGMNVPPALIAGMVVSGAAFGDYLSPMSDTTILASQAARIDLYRHVKSMALTVIPALIITTGVFAFWGRSYNNAYDATTTNEILSTLASHFNITWVALIPIVLVLVLSAMKFPSIPTLLLGIATGGVIALLTQGANLVNFINVLNSGFKTDTGNEMVNTLVNRGGIQGMMPTFLLGFMALCLGGVLQKTGFFHVLVEKVTGKLNHVFPLVLTTMATCALGNAVFGDTYLTIVLNANMYKDAYDSRGLHTSMLSRTIEEAATMSTPLIPWTAASAFIMGALGVPTVEYAGFAVLNLVNPVVSLLFAAIGFGVIRKK